MVIFYGRRTTGVSSGCGSDLDTGRIAGSRVRHDEDIHRTGDHGLGRIDHPDCLTDGAGNKPFTVGCFPSDRAAVDAGTNARRGDIAHHTDHWICITVVCGFGSFEDRSGWAFNDRIRTLTREGRHRCINHRDLHVD